MDEPLKQSIAKQLRNTSLGFLRIKKNLELDGLSDMETEEYLRRIISEIPVESVMSKGKNHYFHSVKFNAILTVNANTYTVITAKKLEE